MGPRLYDKAKQNSHICDIYLNSHSYAVHTHNIPQPHKCVWFGRIFVVLQTLLGGMSDIENKNM